MAPLVYLSLEESRSVDSSSELLKCPLGECVEQPTCLQLSLVETFPDVAWKRKEFKSWNDDKMVSSDMVFSTVYICPSVRAMVGCHRGKTMGPSR